MLAISLPKSPLSSDPGGLAFPAASGAQAGPQTPRGARCPARGLEPPPGVGAAISLPSFLLRRWPLSGEAGVGGGVHPDASRTSDLRRGEPPRWVAEATGEEGNSTHLAGAQALSRGALWQEPQNYP